MMKEEAEKAAAQEEEKKGEAAEEVKEEVKREELVEIINTLTVNDGQGTAAVI
jgi:hypothetical protein